MCVSKGLTRSGFGDVEILDRRLTKQKSRSGGHEIVCRTNLGTFPLTVVVKVIQDKIRTRMVDELAGTVIRTQADIGLLISPEGFSKAARANKEAHRPIRLEFMAGDDLATFLRTTKVGVRRDGDVDYAFFSELEEVSERILAFLKKEDA